VRRDLSLTQLPPTKLVNTPAWVKVFERVPGATIHGHGPTNTTVRASVPLYIEEFNQTYTYQQYAETDESGHFEMILPYSTTMYEGFTPENGYTNTSIRGTTPYQFTSVVTEDVDGFPTAFLYEGQADVPESHVVGESEEAITVDLEGEPLRSGESEDDESTTPEQPAE